MGQDTSSEYVMIGKQRATYRCQVQLPKGANFWPNIPKETLNQCITLYSVSSRTVEALDHLRDHCYGSISGDQYDTYLFRASEETVTPAAKPYFTHYPKGWKENVKFHTMYEGAHLGS